MKMPDRVGQQLGNYRLLRLLGRGGFAEVYLGEHIHLDTQAAIKVLHTQLTSEDMQQFRTEARTIAGLKHSYIIRVLDFGIDGSTPFLVMDYAPNGTLRQRHPRGVPLPLPTVIAYVKQVAAALQYAHDKKLIHRDVKPENMLLGSDNEVLLSDFGIAVVAHSTRSQKVEAAIGTIEYMAPEQIKEKPVPASDQYALGVVVYEWLSGVRPFEGSPGEIYGKHLYIPPPPLREKVPTIPPAVEHVVLTALAKEPQQRFARVQAFATALEQASPSGQLASKGVSSQPTPIVPTAPGESLSALETALPPSQWSQPTVAAPQPHQQAQATTDATPSQSQWAQPTEAPPPQSVEPQAPVVTPPGPSLEPPVVVPSSSQRAIETPSSPGQQAQPSDVDSSPSQPPLTSLPDTPASEPQQPVAASPSEQVLAAPAVSAQPSEPKSPKQGLSRRKVVIGLVGLTGLAVAGGGIIWWEVSLHPHLPYTYRGHSSYVTAVAWSPDGTRIASASGDATVQVWDAADGGHVYTYSGHNGVVTAVAWSPDGTRIASGSEDQTVQAWDAADGANVYTYRGHSYSVYAVAWSPDGKRIASGGKDQTVQVWDAANGGHIYTYRGHSNWVDRVAWSPDGKRIASASNDHTVQVWDATDGGQVFTYRGHSDAVGSVAWSPDGKRIASASYDHTVQVWDATDGGHGYTYLGHTSNVYAVTWSPDGTRIASGSDDQTVQVWQPG